MLQCGKGILCGKNVEIGLRYTQYQVLIGSRLIDVGRFGDEFGSFKAAPGACIEQGLYQGQSPKRTAFARAFVKALQAARIVDLRHCIGAYIRKQLRASLRNDFLIGNASGPAGGVYGRSEEHTSELQSLMSISYAVFCLNKKK